MAEVVAEGLPEEREDSESTQHVCLLLLESVTNQVQPRRVYPVLLACVEGLLQSDSAERVGAAYLILAAMAEGCAERLRVNLSNPLMNIIVPRGLASEHPYIRSCALRTITYFTEFLLPDIVSYHKAILPTVLGYLDSSEPRLVEKSLVALDVLLENMEEQDCCEVAPSVMPALGRCLNSEASTPFMKEVLVSAVGSCLVSMNEAFAPYLAECNALITNCLSLRRAELHIMRVESIKLLGEVAGIFCKSSCPHKADVLANMISGRVDQIYELLATSSDSLIKEACFSFFYNLAYALEA